MDPVLVGGTALIFWLWKKKNAPVAKPAGFISILEEDAAKEGIKYRATVGGQFFEQWIYLNDELQDTTVGEYDVIATPAPDLGQIGFFVYKNSSMVYSTAYSLSKVGIGRTKEHELNVVKKTTYKNNSSYTELYEVVNGSVWSILKCEVENELQYISIRKETNNPNKSTGKQFSSFDNAIKNYSSPEMKLFILKFELM